MKHKHPDDEPFSDQELAEIQAALHLIAAERHALADDDEADDDEKITKKEAHYRPGTAHRHCEICSMFRHGDNRPDDTGTCTSVEGDISPNALCDYFARQKGRAVGGAADDQGEHDDGRVRYERVRGVPEPGSFRLPHHAVHALGAGDGRTAGRVIASLFGPGAGDNPTVIHPDIVRELGHGDAKAGARVLKKFVSMVGRRGHHARG